MESDGENTIIINDMLSFLSCKLNSIPRKKLFSITKEFYPKEEIEQAFNTLLECIPKSYGPTSPKKDLLVEICDLIFKLPEELSPIFVCQNVNNVPQIKIKKMGTSTLTFAGFNLTAKQQQELSTEHANLQNQISEVSNVVRQLKDQMEILVNKCEAYDRESIIKKKVTPIKTQKPLKSVTHSPEKIQDFMEEEITGAFIDTTRIRALRQKPLDAALIPICNLSPKKSKKGKNAKRKAEDELTAAVTSSSDLQFSISEAEDMESKDVTIKDCFIPLGRFDHSSVVVKKEPIDDLNGEDLGRAGRRPHRQKFSKFSEDFVVDFGSRSAKKLKK